MMVTRVPRSLPVDVSALVGRVRPDLGRLLAGRPPVASDRRGVHGPAGSDRRGVHGPVVTVVGATAGKPGADELRFVQWARRPAGPVHRRDVGASPAGSPIEVVPARQAVFAGGVTIGTIGQVRAVARCEGGQRVAARPPVHRRDAAIPGSPTMRSDGSAT